MSIPSNGKGTKTIGEFAGEYRWLSNFELVSVQYQGEWYKSVEHAYQAAKTNDTYQRIQIQLARSPGHAKRLGNTVITCREDWLEVRVDIMRELLRQKFKVEYYRDKLLATGNTHLVEGNRWEDTFWGMCPRTCGQLVGENQLGRLLMEIREEIRNEIKGVEHADSESKV